MFCCWIVLSRKINSLDAAGPIPEELRNLTHLIKLYVLSFFLPRIGGL